MTSTNFYYNTTINGAATSGALSCSGLTNSGTLSSTSAATMGALSCSTIANSSGLVCGALTSSGSMLTYGKFSCTTSGGGMYNPPIETGYTGGLGLLELRSSQQTLAGLFFNSSYGGVNRRWITACSAPDGSYRISDYTPGIREDRMIITPSGTVLNMKFGDGMTIYKDLASSYDLASSSNPAFIYGSFGHVAVSDQFFSDSIVKDVVLTNTGGGRILLGIGSGLSTVQINSSALSCSTIVTSSGLVCGALTSSSQIVGGSITSSGALSCDALSCSSITSSGAISASNVTSGTLSNISYEGIWGTPITGKTLNWARSGKLVSLTIPSNSAYGMSSSSYYIITSSTVLPTQIRPSVTQTFVIPVINNNVYGSGSLRIVNTGSLVVFADFYTSYFAATGNCGIAPNENLTFTYIASS